MIAKGRGLALIAVLVRMEREFLVGGAPDCNASATANNTATKARTAAIRCAILVHVGRRRRQVGLLTSRTMSMVADVRLSAKSAKYSKSSPSDSQPG